MDVSVIIVNYNAAKLIGACLDSVLSQRGVSYEIILVDNASTDDSLAVLSPYQSHICLIKSPKNIGFGRGNNLGLAEAKGEYCFFLNPDAIFTTPNNLAQMCFYMREHPTVGLSGTRIVDTADKDQHALPRVRYPGQQYTSLNFSALPGKIAWVVGASMMVSQKAYQATQGFHPDFFLYGEETEWCFRLRQAGFEIGYNAEVTVQHIGGQSSTHLTAYATWQRKQRGLYTFFRLSYPQASIRKIATIEYYRSCFRLGILAVKGRLLRLSDTQKSKQARYRAIKDNAHCFLTGNIKT